jgi:hypothetical protein
MKFSRLEFLLQQCERHMDVTNTRNTEIESYFVQYLLTRIVAEYETRIVILVQRRCSRTRDIHFKRFAHRGAQDACKRFNIGELKGILARFGPDYKDSFHVKVHSTLSHIAWDNIYANRNGVAHGTGTQMSFGDLKRDYAASLTVLDALVLALCLKPHEIRDLK